MGLELEIEIDAENVPKGIVLPSEIEYDLNHLTPEEWKNIQSMLEELKDALDSIRLKQVERSVQWHLEKKMRDKNSLIQKYRNQRDEYQRRIELLEEKSSEPVKKEK